MTAYNRCLVGVKEQVYKHEIATIKRYGDKYKLTLNKMVREKGWEQIKAPPPDDDMDSDNEIKLDNRKLRNNISRARSKIYELAMCNDFQYFVTCTLDKEKYRRDDLTKFHKDLSQFIRDQRKKYKADDLRYILIPELHKDGKNWHMHGLLGGIRKEMLSPFIRGVHPQRLIDKGYINWIDYANKFGFISVGMVRDKGKAAGYIKKYITEDLDKSVQDYGAHLYYRSQGLRVAELIEKGSLCQVPSFWDYENDYVKIKWITENQVSAFIS